MPQAITATKELPGAGFKCPWPLLIKMDAAVKAKVEKLVNPRWSPAESPGLGGKSYHASSSDNSPTATRLRPIPSPPRT